VSPAEYELGARDLPVSAPTSADAAEWAAKFNAPAKKLMDEGWLLGWFANAICRGMDEVAIRKEASAPRPIQQVEAEAIEHALTYFKGNMCAAARALGIDRRTLYRRVGSQRSRRQALEEAP
jgi:transcriptional regulator of acetoin/glycerol metabolism